MSTAKIAFTGTREVLNGHSQFDQSSYNFARTMHQTIMKQKVNALFMENENYQFAKTIKFRYFLCGF